MPPSKVSPTLRYLTFGTLCDQLLDAIFKVEVSSFMPITKGVHEEWRLQLSEYIQLIPPPILKDIFSETISRYGNRCARSEGRLSMPMLLLHGVVNSSDQSSQEESDTCRRPVWEDGETMVPSMPALFRNLVKPNITRLDFSGLLNIGTVSSGVFDAFNKVLTEVLANVPNLLELILSSKNCRTSLPQCKNEHLAVLGTKCPELTFLDISFIRSITAEGLRYLVPDPESGRHGCPRLKKLYIFECPFHYLEVARLVIHLPDLTDLGCNETGKVIKFVSKRNQTENEVLLKLTKLNNLGSKSRRMIVSTFRFKKSLLDAVVSVAPSIEDIKIRVTDSDVEHLKALEHLRSVELVYNIGSLHSPGIGTSLFLEARGCQLTSVALICNNINMSTLKTLGANCPGLSQLWCRSNYFTLSGGGKEGLPADCSMTHNYFTNLKIFYLRVGEGELSVTYLPEYVLQYVLKNTQSLTELIIAVRSSTINDRYICEDLLELCNLNKLEKLLIVVPGINNLPNIFKLTTYTFNFALQFCPNLRKIGNLLSWTVSEQEVDELVSMAVENCYDIEIMYKKMIMR